MANLSEIKTPDYLDNLSTWEKSRLIFEGGSKLAEALPKVSDDETMDSYSRRKKHYIDRVSIRSVLQDQIAHLQEPKWKIELSAENEQMSRILDNVDGKGTGIVPFAMETFKRCMVFSGRNYIAVDRPVFDRDRTAEEVEKDESADPYAYNIDPDKAQAVDYRTDIQNQVEQIIIQELRAQPGEDTMGFTAKMVPVWRLWTNEIVRVEDADGVGDEATNGLREVPIRFIDLKEGLIEDLYGAVQTANLHYSMANSGMVSAIWGLLVVKTEATIKSMTAGLGQGLTIEPGGDVKYERTPTESIELAAKMADDIFDNVIRAKMRDRQKSMSGVVQESGISKMAEMVVLEGWLQWASERVTDIIQETFELIQLYTNTSLELKVTTPSKFIDSQQTDLTFARELMNFTPVDEETWKEKQKQLRKLLGCEEGMTIEQVNDSNSSIDEAAGSAFEDDEVSELDELEGESEPGGF